MSEAKERVFLSFVNAMIAIADGAIIQNSEGKQFMMNCDDHRIHVRNDKVLDNQWVPLDDDNGFFMCVTTRYELVALPRSAAAVPEQTGGIKLDEGKVQLDLLSPSWIVGVGQVLTFGASKYQAHNWRKGLQRSRLLAAGFRHMYAYLGGEDVDPETNLLHLYHASCCLMFASELHFTMPETDDRFKKQAQKT